MRVVIADADLCYPPTSGKRLRTLHLMSRLARRHRITYVCRCDAAPTEMEKARSYLLDQRIEARLIAQPRPRKTGLTFCARLAGNLLSSLPYSVTSHASPALEQALRRCAAEEHVDLWQFEWPAYAEALRGLSSVRTIVAAHNVESLIWQRYHQTESNPLKRWYIKRQWQKYEAFERRAFAAATRVVTCSEDDAALVRDSFSVPGVDVVENGVDTAYFEEFPRREQNSKQVLFLGALDYRPNTDAVNLLLEQIFPAVRAREPAARLCIVGRNPPPALAKCAAAIDNVELHPNVPDVRPFLAESAVMAVPLRIGGGSRLKILEALAAGLPVVSTRVGAEGLELASGEEIDIVASAEQIPEALVTALQRPERGQAMAQRGRQVARERYDWDILADKLERVWESCVCVPRSVSVALRSI